MTEELEAGCTRPSGGPVDKPEIVTQQDPVNQTKEAVPMIKVGKKAPDFQAAGYQKGKFINAKLSDHLGKWVLLCFYPGDFTFV